MIPLYVRDKHGVESVVPVPCILDTGAPKMLYFGRIATNILTSIGCIQWGVYNSWVIGKIQWKGVDIINPDV